MCRTRYRNEWNRIPFSYLSCSESIVESPKNIASEKLVWWPKDTTKSKSSGELDAFETCTEDVTSVSSVSEQNNMALTMTRAEGDASASSESKQNKKKYGLAYYVPRHLICKILECVDCKYFLNYIFANKTILNNTNWDYLPKIVVPYYFCNGPYIDRTFLDIHNPVCNIIECSEKRKKCNDYLPRP